MSPKITKEILIGAKHLIALGEEAAKVKKFIATATGLGKTQTAENYKKILAAPAESTTESYDAILSASGDEMELSSQHFGLKTLEELLDRCKICREEWDVVSFRPNSWPALTKDGPIMFSQVKASLTRKMKKSLSEDLESIKKELKNLSPICKKYTYDFQRAGGQKGLRLLEVSVFDLHFGKFVDSLEAGHSYNMKLARDMFLDSVADLVEKAEMVGGIDQILFPIGNDYLNIDNNQKMTTSGTPQDCDGNFQRIYKEGRKLLIDAINLLKQHAPVNVIAVPGNHEMNSLFHIADAIECYFYNDDNVTVDNSPRYRKYYNYGANLLVFTHGDKGKMNDLPLLAATEEPQLWAKSKFREVHVGHLHQEMYKEIKGFKIRIIPSLSGNDLWHNQSGYVGNIRQAQGFIYDYENGLEAILYSKPV